MKLSYKSYCYVVLTIIYLLLNGCTKKEHFDFEVVVIGDGTGAVTAAIQAARSGAQTILLTELPWLGGMLTSAGVSAIDGNHELPAGIWGEFRDSIYQHYGGPDKVATGWVSNTHFEPKIGNRIFQNMANNEPNLTIEVVAKVEKIHKKTSPWIVEYKNISAASAKICAKILIDGTDLGDVAALAGASFDIGMEEKEAADELIGSLSNKIIQDLTYVAILEKSTDESTEQVIRSPSYDPSIFYCACEELCPEPTSDVHPCDVMMNYAKLPNEKYLINWPIHGNDVYLNIIDYDQSARDSLLEAAKEKTMNFIYFIQYELGYSHLRLSKSEFPTDDNLPLMPYHREGRRIDGKVRFTSKHIKFPDEYTIYRTGIAVGNYPIDHHHKERPDIPEMDFPAVPSYSVPIGALIPDKVENLIIADKAISVSNIANGTTRLQPVILQIGQVAGLIAAEAIKSNLNSSKVDIRTIQGRLLDLGGYISPFKDLPKGDPQFKAAQRIAACGLIDLEERPYKWANETWLHSDSMMLMHEAEKLMANFYKFPAKLTTNFNERLSISQFTKLLYEAQKKSIKISVVQKALRGLRGTQSKNSDLLTRKEYIYLIDKILDPFHSRAVNFKGEWEKNN